MEIENKIRERIGKGIDLLDELIPFSLKFIESKKNLIMRKLNILKINLKIIKMILQEFI